MSSLKYHITDEETLKEMLHQNFIKIRQMSDVPDGIRVKLLSTLFSANPNNWRVVGITQEALKVFEKYQFERVSRMGINRSHLVQRAKQYKEMLFDFDLFDEKYGSKELFWKHYLEGDKTILATSKENMSDELSTVYDINPELGLFRTKGYAWKHGEEEIKYLKLLWKEKNL